MPQGNAQKAAIKRERNAQKAAQQNAAHSQLDANKKAQTIMCQSCRQTFQMTSKVADLEMHHTSKHPKLPFSQCFPDANPSQ